MGINGQLAEAGLVPSHHHGFGAEYVKDSHVAYIMIKPDGVQRGLVGKIIQRFEDRGFQVRAAC